MGNIVDFLTDLVGITSPEPEKTNPPPRPSELKEYVPEESDFDPHEGYKFLRAKPNPNFNRIRKMLAEKRNELRTTKSLPTKP